MFLSASVIILVILQGGLSETISSSNLREPPIQDGPVAVSIGFYVLGMTEINERKMEYTISMYFRESWKDKRIKFNLKSPVYVQSYQYKKFWFPDIFMRNEKQSFIHDLMLDNRMFKISSDGTIWHVTKITSTLACPMDFHRFPFDTQGCSIYFESFSYTMDTLYLQWLPHPVTVAEDVILPKYKLQEHLLYDCSQNYTTGTYPCLEVRFILRRDIFYSINCFFLPTIFFVLLAWLSFFIDLNKTVHRIVLSSIAVFLVLAQHKGIKSDLPMTSYLTAADLWTIICVSIISYTIVVHVVINKLLNAVRNPQKANVEVEKVADDNDEKPKEIKKTDKFISGLKNILLGDGMTRGSDKSKQKAEHLNAVSRLVVVVAFVLISIIYFCCYTC